MAAWTKRWGYEVQATSRKGVWRLRDGGYLVACRITDSRTGRRLPRSKVVRDAASVAEAARALDELRDEVRAVASGKTRSTQRFSEYAASLFERKVLSGEWASPATRELWELILRKHLLPPLGDFFCHELRKTDIEDLKAKWGKRFATPAYFEVPHPKKQGATKRVRNPEHMGVLYANTLLAKLRAVTASMTIDLELDRDPSLGVKDFDTSTHKVHTRERPNSMSAEQAAGFLAEMRVLFPQHYPMVLLGLVTGWRPSTLRALRRKGPEADVLWDEGVILVRRSAPRGQEIMNKTKTAKDQSIALPPGIMAVLREHADRLELCRETAGSELLFPATHGGIISRSVLDKPFRAVALAVGIPYKVTPKAMRRSFKDVAREAGVADIVSKAISGHMTEAMHEHYSTVRDHETRAAATGISEVLGALKSDRKAVKKAVKDSD